MGSRVRREAFQLRFLLFDGVDKSRVSSDILVLGASPPPLDDFLTSVRDQKRVAPKG